MSNTPAPLKIPTNGLFPTPEVRGWDLLRQMRKTPTLLYGIFSEIIQQLYLNPDNLALGVPKKQWSPDKDKTQIWIDTELRWNDDHPEFRPAIFVKLSPISYSSLTGRNDGVAGGRLQTAEEDFSRSGEGTVSFVHIAESAGEACMLGDATLDYLDGFSKVIRDDFCFTTFSLTGRIPMVQMDKTSKEQYGSVVECKFTFQDRWTLKLESQILKSFIMRTGHRILQRGIVR